MTISNQSNRTSAVGTGAEQTVPFSFPILDNSDITVTSRLITSGVETILVETTNYTVINSGTSGGSVVTVTPFIASTSEIHIIRNTPNTQSIDLIQGGEFSAERVESGLDKVTKLGIENQDAIDRTIRLPDTDSASIDMVLPNSIDRASKFLKFDSSGNLAVSSEVDSTTITVSTFMETLLDDADAKTGKATLQSDTVLDIRDYGVVGDGVTDDTTNFNTALAAAQNKTLHLQAGASYNLTGALNMAERTIFEGNGAILNFTIATTPKSQCLAVANYCIVRNFTSNQLSTTVAGDGSWAVPIGIGTSDDLADTGPHHILIDNVTVSQATDHAMIGVFGDSHDIIIRNVEIPASTTAIIGILTHWAWSGAVEGSQSNHPHNIIIENVKCAGLKKAADPGDSYVVFLSGSYNVSVSNVESIGTWGGAKIQPGTPGDQLAKASQKEFILTGITIKDCSFNDTSTGVAATFSTGGSFSFLDHEPNIIFSNIKARGLRSTNAGTAAVLSNLRGLTIENSRFENFDQGIRIVDSAPNTIDNLMIKGVIIKEINNGGIPISALNSRGITIEDCKISDVYKVGTGGGTTEKSFISTNCPKTIIRNCELGLTASEGAILGITVTTGATECVVEDIHILGISDTATIFQNDVRGTIYNRIFTDNTTATFDGGTFGVMSTLADEATPSVAHGRQWVTGGTTTIADFDDGMPSQIITVIAENTIKITDGANINLKDNSDWIMQSGDTLTLILKNDNIWYETGRSHNSTSSVLNIVVYENEIISYENEIITY